MLLPTLATITLVIPLLRAAPTPSRTAPSASPRVAPAHVAPPRPNSRPLSSFASIFGSIPTEVANLSARDVGELMLRGVSFDVVGGSLSERDFALAVPLERRGSHGWSRYQRVLAQKAIAQTCVGSSANDTYISSVSRSPGFLFPVPNH